MVHKENGGLDVKGLPIAVLDYHHFKKEGPDQKGLCPSNSTYKQITISKKVSGQRLHLHAFCTWKCKFFEHENVAAMP